MPISEHKQQFYLTLSKNVVENLTKVAEANHMEVKPYAALWLGRICDLKAEHALDALAAIPKEYFKARPGRPANGPHRSDLHEPAPAGA